MDDSECYRKITKLGHLGVMSHTFGSLTQKWMSTNEKMQNLVERGYEGSCDPLIEF